MSEKKETKKVKINRLSLVITYQGLSEQSYGYQLDVYDQTVENDEIHRAHPVYRSFLYVSNAESYRLHSLLDSKAQSIQKFVKKRTGKHVSKRTVRRELYEGARYLQATEHTLKQW